MERTGRKQIQTREFFSSPLDFWFPLGASSIKCCYAAKGISVASALPKIVECANTNIIFSDAKGTILNEKTSLNVSFLWANPACRADVLTYCPNLNAW